MGCKPKKTKCQRICRNKKSVIKVVEEKKIPSNLQEKGRLQYFFHSLSSTLPIRDILDEQHQGHKTEPHIEIGAENYINKCYPVNIRKFAEGDEKYLFLITTCRNKEMNKKINERFGRNETNQFIVGYIVKEKVFEIDGRICIKGPTFIYSFEESMLVKDLFHKNFSQTGNKKTLSLLRKSAVNKNKTEKILNHFKGKHNKRLDCVEKIKKLDRNDITCIGKNCKFYKNGCLRWK